MYKRQLAASAVAIVAVGALAPAAAFAGTAAGTSHVSARSLSGSARSSSSLASARQAQSAKTVVGHAVGTLTPDLSLSDLGALTVEAYGLGSTDSGSTISNYSFDFGDGTAAVSNSTGVADHAYAKPGAYTITVTVTDAASNVATASQAYTTWGTDFTAYGPTRLLDTRTGTGAAKGIVAAGGTVSLQVAGTGTIPADATAVVMNITVTQTTGAGFVTAYPDGTPVPTASNLNYGPGKTVPNLAIVPIGADGKVALTNAGPGSTQLIADVTGYFTATAASGYTSLTPSRILDTRNGTGAAKAIVGAGKSVILTVAGADGGALPASGITAVALNVTVTQTTGGGFVTLYPDGSALPNASNLNYGQGQTVPNLVIVPVGADGKVVLNNAGPGSTQLIADVTGYFSAGSASAYAPVGPYRVLDTRAAGAGGPLLAGQTGALDFGDPTYPTSAYLLGMTGFVVNTTVTNTKSNGFLTVFPDGVAVPGVSNLNWAAGQTVPNLVLATPSADAAKTVDFYNAGSGQTDLIVDMSGFFTTY